ncbi:hypothetical protein ACIRQQ_11105 [Streptomyces fuscichromogenes]
MTGGAKAHYDAITALPRPDFTDPARLPTTEAATINAGLLDFIRS